MHRRIKNLIQKEKVLCIAALCALISIIFVPPCAAYADYIDARVLGLLWCLMAVVAGFRKSGAFDTVTYVLLTKNRGGTKMLSVLLVLLPFFVSMAVTNDVALIAFVPFTIELLTAALCDSAIIPMLVLQTLAANLGSMATPVGNPQNLFLYGYYELTAAQFFDTLFALTLLSLVALSLAALPVLPKKMPTPMLAAPEKLKKSLWLYLALFVLCLLAVVRIVPWYAVLAVVLLALACADRALLREPDYALLLTFVCFFVFSGNLGQIPAVSNALRMLLQRNTLLTAVLTSQFISNVPAAVLLAPFTQDWQGLLLGVDIGGLGTPIASLASLITLKFYMALPNAKPLRYLAVFTAACAAGLALLLGATAILF